MSAVRGHLSGTMQWSDNDTPTERKAGNKGCEEDSRCVWRSLVHQGGVDNGGDKDQWQKDNVANNYECNKERVCECVLRRGGG